MRGAQDAARSRHSIAARRTFSASAMALRAQCHAVFAVAVEHAQPRLAVVGAGELDARRQRLEQLDRAPAGGVGLGVAQRADVQVGQMREVEPPRALSRPAGAAARQLLARDRSPRSTGRRSEHSVAQASSQRARVSSSTASAWAIAMRQCAAASRCAPRSLACSAADRREAAHRLRRRRRARHGARAAPARASWPLATSARRTSCVQRLCHRRASEDSTATRASSWRKLSDRRIGQQQARVETGLEVGDRRRQQRVDQPALDARRHDRGQAHDGLCLAWTGARSGRAPGPARVRGTSSSGWRSSSVTKKGLPCVTAYRPCGERGALRASCSTAAGDRRGRSMRVTSAAGSSPITRRSGWLAATSSSRKLTASSAWVRSMRRPRNLMRSSVASSAQCASSITTSIGSAAKRSSSSTASNSAVRGPARAAAKRVRRRARCRAAAPADAASAARRKRPTTTVSIGWSAASDAARWSCRYRLRRPPK